MQEMQEMWVWSLGQKHPLEEKVATYSSILAWATPWAKEHGELQAIGSRGSDMTWWLNKKKKVRVVSTVASVKDGCPSRQAVNLWLAVSLQCVSTSLSSTLSLTPFQSLRHLVKVQGTLMVELQGPGRDPWSRQRRRHAPHFHAQFCTVVILWMRSSEIYQRHVTYNLSRE